METHYFIGKLDDPDSCRGERLVRGLRLQAGPQLLHILLHRQKHAASLQL